jgi:nickel/cobalt transporter (NicO) family protein
MPPMTAAHAIRASRRPDRRRRALLAAVAGLVLVVMAPSLALAHPLGNFTINHYAGIRVEPDRLILDVVIDQAEIPTFQEKLRIDRDGDGSVSDNETAAERATACPALAPSLVASAGGRSLSLVPVAAGLTFPPGAAGLETMRLACTYSVALPAPLAAGTTIAFSDRSHSERLGWREVTVQGSGVTVEAGGLPAASISKRLTAYPTDLLTRPLDIRSASFKVSPGGPALAPFAVPDAFPLPGAAPLGPIEAGSGTVAAVDPVRRPPTGAVGTEPQAGPGVQAAAVGGAAVPGGVGGELAGLLETRDLTPLVILGAFVAAMALGAGHALTPGHGKTLMGAYLVGTRGTSIHAIALGLSVTVSHTLGILVLAAIVIALRGVISPEMFNRIAPVASGILVLGIGTWLVVSQVRTRRTTEATHHHADHDHDHADHDHADHDHADHDHADHDHADHDRGHPHDDHQIDADGTHSHGGVSHSHLPPSGSKVSWRSLFVLGLAGGIIPSTNALIILLATIASGRPAYGLVLVIAFGLGMAVVLGGVGLGLVFARDRLDRLPSRSSLGRAASYAPVMAGVLVFGLGIYLTTQAVGVAPTL